MKIVITIEESEPPFQLSLQKAKEHLVSPRVGGLSGKFKVPNKNKSEFPKLYLSTLYEWI